MKPAHKTFDHSKGGGGSIDVTPATAVLKDSEPSAAAREDGLMEGGRKLDWHTQVNWKE